MSKHQLADKNNDVQLLTPYWNTTTNVLTFSAEPLPFRNEGYSVALLMDCEIATITKHDRISVLAVTIVAYRAFAILFFTSTH